MVGAEQDDLGFVSPISLHIEDGLGLDDAGVIQMNSTDLVGGILPEGISDVFVTHGHDNVGVYVVRLHNDP